MRAIASLYVSFLPCHQRQSKHVSGAHASKILALFGSTQRSIYPASSRSNSQRLIPFSWDSPSFKVFRSIPTTKRDLWSLEHIHSLKTFRLLEVLSTRGRRKNLFSSILLSRVRCQRLAELGDYSFQVACGLPRFARVDDRRSHF